METYGNYVNGTSEYVRVTCLSLSTLRKLRLRKSRHIVLSSGLVLIQSCPRRCGSVWDHWIVLLYGTQSWPGEIWKYLDLRRFVSHKDIVSTALLNWKYWRTRKPPECNRGAFPDWYSDYHTDYSLLLCTVLSQLIWTVCPTENIYKFSIAGVNWQREKTDEEAFWKKNLDSSLTSEQVLGLLAFSSSGSEDISASLLFFSNLKHSLFLVFDFLFLIFQDLAITLKRKDVVE